MKASVEMELARRANERRMLIQQSLLDEATNLLARKREIPIVPADEEHAMVHH